MTYIHYGHSRFDKDTFERIENMQLMEPKGGLWGSPERSEYGWREWCEMQDFQVSRLEESFQFRLKEGSRVYVIDSKEATESILEEEKTRGLFVIDYEKLSKRYDAIYITLTGIQETRLNIFCLYRWDCESILVMNPDCIEV